MECDFDLSYGGSDEEQFVLLTIKMFDETDDEHRFHGFYNP